VKGSGRGLHDVDMKFDRVAEEALQKWAIGHDNARAENGIQHHPNMKEN
jgi:hypothetical protein